jgi:hypothetical protein
MVLCVEKIASFKWYFVYLVGVELSFSENEREDIIPRRLKVQGLLDPHWYGLRFPRLAYHVSFNYTIFHCLMSFRYQIQRDPLGDHWFDLSSL